MQPENGEWMLVHHSSDEDEGMSKPSSPTSIATDKTGSADEHIQAASYLETFGLLDPAVLADMSDTADDAADDNATAEEEQNPCETTATDSTFISNPQIVEDHVASSHGSPAPQTMAGNQRSQGTPRGHRWEQLHELETNPDEVDSLDIWIGCGLVIIAAAMIAVTIRHAFLPYPHSKGVAVAGLSSTAPAPAFPHRPPTNEGHRGVAPPSLLKDNSGSLASPRARTDRGLDLEARLQRLELESLAATQRLNAHDVRLASLEAHINDLEERLFNMGADRKRKNQRDDAKLKGDGQAQIDALTKVVVRGPSELAVAQEYAHAAGNKENIKHPNFVMVCTDDEDSAYKKGSHKGKDKHKHKMKVSKHHK